MRLFLAIDVPKKANSILKAYYSDLSQNMEGSFTEHLHCTLKFLGEVDTGLLPQLCERLRAISMERFICTLSRFGHFGNSIFYAGVESPELHLLQKKVLKAVTSLHNATLNNELNNTLNNTLSDSPQEKYIPHITLVRIKSIISKERFQYHLALPLPHFRFDVLEFVLFKSTLTPAGPKYEIIEKFPLSGPQKQLQKDYRLPPL